MAAVMGRTEVGVRQFGTTVTVPANPKAKLMYYLDCICTVMDLSDERNLTKLRDFRNYHALTEAETDALIALALLLSPEELTGKVIFQDDEMCGSSSNTFYELSSVHDSLVLTDSIVIGGQRRTVKKIMAYTREWFYKNWYTPMLSFTERLAGLAAGQTVTTQRPTIGYRSSNHRYNTFPEPSYTQSENNSDSCCCCSCTIL